MKVTNKINLISKKKNRKVISLLKASVQNVESITKLKSGIEGKKTENLKGEDTNAGKYDFDAAFAIANAPEHHRKFYLKGSNRL